MILNGRLGRRGRRSASQDESDGDTPDERPPMSPFLFFREIGRPARVNAAGRFVMTAIFHRITPDGKTGFLSTHPTNGDDFGAVDSPHRDGERTPRKTTPSFITNPALPRKRWNRNFYRFNSMFLAVSVKRAGYFFVVSVLASCRFGLDRVK